MRLMSKEKRKEIEETFQRKIKLLRRKKKTKNKGKDKPKSKEQIQFSSSLLSFLDE